MQTYLDTSTCVHTCIADPHTCVCKYVQICHISVYRRYVHHMHMIVHLCGLLWCATLSQFPSLFVVASIGLAFIYSTPEKSQDCKALSLTSVSPIASQPPTGASVPGTRLEPGPTEPVRPLGELQFYVLTYFSLKTPLQHALYALPFLRTVILRLGVAQNA